MAIEKRTAKYKATIDRIQICRTRLQSIKHLLYLLTDEEEQQLNDAIDAVAKLSVDVYHRTGC